MESSRDSSVWRNLAVTFGGGLALGAVGMKLTQTAHRPAEVTPRPEPNVLTDRLSVMERRLERVEQAPVRPAAPIDQKVLEAVIGAVDARLHEHAGQVDRRLADLEARAAVSNQQTAQELRKVRESLSFAVAAQAETQSEVQTLRQQNERIVDAADMRFDDMRREYSQQAADLRESVSQAFEEQASAQEQRMGELLGNFERSIETRLVTAAAAAAVDRVEEHLAPLRAQVRQKEQELAELRQRLADSERSVLDVILAIGVVCRQAADRIDGSREQPPAAPPPATEAVPECVAVAAEPPAAEPVPELEPQPARAAEVEPIPVRSAPEFLNGPSREAMSWRIPLVSSFLVSTGYLVLMHYLSASLQ